MAGIRCRECHQGYIKLFHSALPPPSPPVAVRPERYLDEKILGFSNRWYKPFSVLTSLRRFPTRSMSEMAILQQLSYRRYPCVMRPLRYSINVTLDGCCDHRAIPADEDLHRHAIQNLDQADALLFGRVTYEMMEAAFRAPTLVRNPG